MRTSLRSIYVRITITSISCGSLKGTRRSSLIVSAMQDAGRKTNLDQPALINTREIAARKEEHPVQLSLGVVDNGGHPGPMQCPNRSASATLRLLALSLEDMPWDLPETWKVGSRLLLG